MDARETLKERLRDAEVAEADLDDAERGGRFATLAVQVALGGTGNHSLTAVARESGVPVSLLRELFQAIGRPNPPRGTRCFTDEDIELAQIARALLDAGLQRDQMIEVARVFGQSTSQIAEALRQVFGEALLEPGDSEHSLALRYAEAVDMLGPLVPALLGLAVRAHLRDGMQREVITDAEREAGTLAETREVAIAFADLAGYTALGSNVGSETLGSIAGRFGELVTRSLRQPVRLVKMIGDGAMFASPDVPALCATLAELSDLVADAEPDLPPIRTGVAYGPATARGGDWYGATVNLASRIAENARPGQTLATDEVVSRVSRDGWKRHRKLRLKGVGGRVTVFTRGG